MSSSGTRIDVLGRLRLRGPSGVLEAGDLGGRKPRQVLQILLASRGEPVSKDRLAELLWGSRQPQDPMRTLEAYVSVLRAHLSDVSADPRRVVRTDSSGYRLGTDEVTLDLDSFDATMLRAAEAEPSERVALRRAAADLYRGEALAEEPYADWARPLRDLYRERWLTLLLDLAEDCLAAGLPGEAAAHAIRVLGEQPLRERAYRLLMGAQYASGDQAAALATYHECKRVLADELGVDPLPETEQTFTAVLRQEPLPAPARPLAGPTLVAERTPPIHYARNGAATIAYQAVGSGDVDVVLAHAWFSHMEVSWEEPRYRDFVLRLAAGRRVLLFDRRGMGMSDPAPPTVGLDERVGDILAVMDDADSRRAVLLGSCGSGPAILSLAAQAPERTRGLVLFGTFARLTACPGYPMGWSPEFFEAYKSGLEAGWSTGRGVLRSVPSAGSDERLMEWLARLLRLSASPATARDLMDFSATLDVRDLLGRIAAPTLVLHRRDDQWVGPENGAFLAGHIPGSRLQLLDGADHWPWFGDAEPVLHSIEEFIAQL